MVTADTITDEQLASLYAWASVIRSQNIKSSCLVAIYGHPVRVWSRKVALSVSKQDPRYRSARAFCADTFNKHCDDIAAYVERAK